MNVFKSYIVCKDGICIIMPLIYSDPSNAPENAGEQPCISELTEGAKHTFGIGTLVAIFHAQ